MAAENLLEVTGLKTWFHTDRGTIKAVDGVELRIGAHETLGVVGESGCGKSVTALSIMQLIDAPGKIESGTILFRNENLLAKSRSEMQRIRGNQISMIFQEPMTSLNPVHSVGDQIAEAVMLHQKLDRGNAMAQAKKMLELVGIPDPVRRLSEYPHQLSGGMRQRVMIAMALSCNPSLLIADEPTTALDVTVQAQILDLMRRLKSDIGASLAIITHDLGVIAEMADKVLVMYAGKVVEYCDVQSLFGNPGHPYTRELLDSIPRITDEPGRKLHPIEGSIPDLSRLPSGCSFHPRCRFAQSVCSEEEPPLESLGDGRLVRCWMCSPEKAGLFDLTIEAVARGSGAGEPVEAAVSGGTESSIQNRDAGFVEMAFGKKVVITPEQAVPPAPGAGFSPLLQVRGLRKHFPITGGLFRRVVGSVKAVDGIDFDIGRGETLGLVGESGCGKTTTGRLVLRLLEPSAGTVLFEGQDIYRLGTRQMRARRRDMQIVFQDPFASLNPRMTVGQILEEAFIIHGERSGKDLRARIAQLLEQVGLHADHAQRYPHQFSGGQRQRIGIARALCLNPKLVVCDEPVSALDVSIQAQIINLLEELQERLGLTYLFIAHNLSVVRHISDRVAVMYLGKIVELAASESVFGSPAHPYTEALLSAVPVPDTRIERKRLILAGDVPSPSKPPSGCHFHPRCPRAMPQCREIAPALADIGGGHLVSCHLHSGKPPAPLAGLLAGNTAGTMIRRQEEGT